MADLTSDVYSSTSVKKEVNLRTERDTHPGDTAVRDLDRYYTLLRFVRPTFTEGEALLLLRALNGPMLSHPTDPLLRDVQSIWQHVLVGIEHRLERDTDVNSEDFVERLRGLSAVECLSVWDAAETFWHSEEVQSIEDFSKQVRFLGLLAVSSVG